MASSTASFPSAGTGIHDPHPHPHPHTHTHPLPYPHPPQQQQQQQPIPPPGAGPNPTNLDSTKQRPRYWAPPPPSHPSSAPVMTNGSSENHNHPGSGSIKPLGPPGNEGTEIGRPEQHPHVKSEPSAAPPYGLPPHQQEHQHSPRLLQPAYQPHHPPNVHYPVDPSRPGSSGPPPSTLPQLHHPPPHQPIHQLPQPQQQQQQQHQPPPPPTPTHHHHQHPPQHQLAPQHPPQHPPPPPPQHSQGQGPGPPPPPQPVGYAPVQPYPPPPSIPGGNSVGQYHHHSQHPQGAGYGGPPLRHMSSGGLIAEDEMNQGMGDMSVPAGAYLGAQTYAPQRRKAVRAAQACDACRQRKAKCDEGRPSCSFCKDAGQPCVYREVPPPKQDRTLMQILERLSRIESFINNPEEPDSAVIQLLKKHITERVESSGINVGQNFGRANAIKTEPPSPQHFRPPHLQTSDRAFQTPPIPGSQSNPLPVQTPSQTSRPGVPRSLADTEESEDDQKLTMPIKHNTAAQKLLSWSSIKNLFDNEAYADSYVLDAEYSRGQLRIFGRGEEDLDGCWVLGEDEYLTRPGSSNGEDLNNIGEGGGLGLGARDGLKIDIETVRELLQSFCSNIYLLHPIFDREALTQMVYTFAEMYGGGLDSDIAIDETYSHVNAGVPISPHTSFGSVASVGLPPKAEPMGMSTPHGPIRSASFSGTSSSPTGSGTKRKREANSQAGPPPPPPPPPRRTHSHGYGAHDTMHRRQDIPKTMHSAIVLMVLALGAVTRHRRPVPGALPSLTRLPVIGHSFYHPIDTSLPGGGVRLTHSQPSFEGEHLTNVDVIPGLAYFAKAIEILVLYTGSNSVPFVQCALLAGLYWGQLGRVLDSWKWICHACIACQAMMNYRWQREKDDIKKDIMLRVYWSCLQLESDVLAELDLPPSGITRLESSTDLPQGPNPLAPEDTTLWLCYFAQCHLRRILNRVHSWLYKASAQTDPNAAVTAANELETQLESWKDTLPKDLQWLDTDPPATDINLARLRAKYYGAKYIIHRPFVQQTINVSKPGGGPISASPAMSVSEMSHHGSPSTSVTTPVMVRKPSIISDPSSAGPSAAPSLEASCKKCINAAIQSTSAFHGFNADINRPVVTNVFGTAHAQFGNLLVLQAAYKSPQLRHLVDPLTLKRLLKKTMHFLRTLSPISAALRMDVQILEESSKKMDFMNDR